MNHETPRTDAAEPQLHSNKGGWVRADFARELECELAAYKNEALCLRDDHDLLYRDYQKLEAEVEELQQQKRNCIEIIDDDAKEKSELKAEVERLTKLLSLEREGHEGTKKLCAKILDSTRKTPSMEWHRKNRKVLLK